MRHSQRQMKLSATQDLNVPQAVVFEHVSDFERFEQIWAERGAPVTRTGDGPAGVGTVWSTHVSFGGRTFSSNLRLVDFTPPSGFVAIGSASDLSGRLTVSCLAVGEEQTKLTVSIELAAEAWSGRFLLGSLRLGRVQLSHKLRSAVAKYVREIERRNMQPTDHLSWRGRSAG